MCIMLEVFPNELCNDSILDSLHLDHSDKPKPIEAFLLTTGINCGVWAFDRYVLNADYAKIDFKSIGDNFNKGLVWDNDKMETNMIMHPYHGSLYFNSARSNGFNFWQSSLFSVGGSAMWEFLMENEYPSTNDIIATPIGGMVLGEVFYRTSDMLIDERTIGFERFKREFGVFLLSPMRGVSRLINGDLWRRNVESGRQFSIPSIKFEMSLGLRMTELNNCSNVGSGLVVGFDFEYGDRFDENSATAFDYFRVNMMFNVQKSQPLLGGVDISGRLFNSSLINEDYMNLNIGFYQQYGFYNQYSNSQNGHKLSFKYSTPASIGLGGMCYYKGYNWGTIEGECYLNGVILGAFSSDYYNVDNRDYNFASGFSIKFGASYLLPNEKIKLLLSHNLYKLYSWQGYGKEIDLSQVNSKSLNVQGDASQALINTTAITLKTIFNDDISASFSLLNESYRVNYKHYNDSRNNNLQGRILLNYRF